MLLAGNNLDNISKEYVAEVNRIFADKLKKVILYGSYARGDFDEYSDIDVMTLVDMTNDEIEKKFNKVIHSKCEIDDKYNVYLSPMVINVNHFNEWVPFLPFYRNVTEEGVVWYG